MAKTKILMIGLVLYLSGCGGGEGDFLPKPKGYNFISLPTHEFQALKEDGLPYSFEYSKHAVAVKDTTSWKDIKRNYRIIDYPDFNSKIHLTYKSIDNNIDSLNSYINESYRLLEGHDKKTYGRESKVDTINGKIVFTFELEGEVPSPYQFFTHDSSHHFLRGALYFNTSHKNDSLRPVISFVKEDTKHLLRTLNWE